MHRNAYKAFLRHERTSDSQPEGVHLSWSSITSDELETLVRSDSFCKRIAEVCALDHHTGQGNHVFSFYKLQPSGTYVDENSFDQHWFPGTSTGISDKNALPLLRSSSAVEVVSVGTAAPYPIPPIALAEVLPITYFREALHSHFLSSTILEERPIVGLLLYTSRTDGYIGLLQRAKELDISVPAHRREFQRLEQRLAHRCDRARREVLTGVQLFESFTTPGLLTCGVLCFSLAPGSTGAHVNNPEVMRRFAYTLPGKRLAELM